MADISVIILTFNEEKHIARCINSLMSFAKEVFVVDSFSTDETVSIAESQGAKVYQNQYTNQAIQFNWALKTCPVSTEWIMRIDADEYVLPELSNEINNKLPLLEQSISGIFIKRRLIFLNRWIKHGGNYPIWLLRIWRNGKGYCEDRWIDEHMKVTEGQIVYFENDFVDENLSSLAWWINKQNNHSTREMITLILDKYQRSSKEEVTRKLTGSPDQKKRWFKQTYAKTPLFVRSLLLFLYVYFLRGGFRDGYPGLIRQFFMVFWYRFLVDSKIYEINKHCGKNFDAIKNEIEKEYGYKI